MLDFYFITLQIEFADSSMDGVQYWKYELTAIKGVGPY